MNVVLLHGWGMNQGIWSGFKDQLSEGLALRVTCLDLPGFGLQQNKRMRPYTLETISLDIHQQLPENCMLIGWSLGGLVAQYIAAHYANKVLAQVLICSTPKFSQADDWPGIQDKVLEMFSQQLQTDHESLLKRFLAIQCMGLPNAKHSRKSMLGKLSAFPLSTKEALLDSLSILNDTDLRGDIGSRCPIPSLRIFGRMDSLIPRNVIPEIEILSPDSKIKIIPKASHAPFISHPQETLDCIKLFLDRLNKGSQI